MSVNLWEHALQPVCEWTRIGYGPKIGPCSPSWLQLGWVPRVIVTFNCNHICCPVILFLLNFSFRSHGFGFYSSSPLIMLWYFVNCCTKWAVNYKDHGRWEEEEVHVWAPVSAPSGCTRWCRLCRMLDPMPLKSKKITTPKKNCLHKNNY